MSSGAKHEKKKKITLMRPPKSARGIKQMARTKDMDQAIELCMRVVNESVKELGLAPSNTAAVFDIDDTVLMEGGRGRNAHPLGAREAARLQAGVIQLFNLCKKAKWKTFFVTARPATKENMEWTKGCLHKADIRGWDSCFHCPVEMRDSYENISEYKRRARNQIEEKHGVKIVLSAGDRFADVVDHSHLDEEEHPLGGRSDDIFVLTIKDKRHSGLVGLKLPHRG
jgi:hypothetical protein